MQGGILCKQTFARGGGTLNKTPLTKVKKMNIIIFVLVGISLFSLTTFTSYALFTNETEGQNTLSLTVSTAGRISIRIFEQDTGTEDVTFASHQNVIKFNVKDGLVMDSVSCTTGEATYNKATNILTINNATQNGTCEINYVEGYRKLYDVILSEPLKTNNGLSVTTETNSDLPSYYYKGQVENNYISLPEKNGDTTSNALYRIVRINEDGSIRVIRQDSIGQSLFSKSGDFSHIYYSNSNVDGGIMKTVNNWYASAINSTALDQKIVESSFCEQAKIAYTNFDTSSMLGSQIIMKITNSYGPSLKCEADANGKGPLTMKVGLLTLDEAVMVGCPFNSEPHTDHQNTYLYQNYTWYTMSPAGGDDYQWVWVLSISDTAFSVGVSGKYEVRPVLSLSPNVEITGKGTSTSPYELVLN